MVGNSGLRGGLRGGVHANIALCVVLIPIFGSPVPQSDLRRDDLKRALFMVTKEPRAARFIWRPKNERDRHRVADPRARPGGDRAASAPGARVDKLAQVRGAARRLARPRRARAHQCVL